MTARRQNGPPQNLCPRSKNSNSNSNSRAIGGIIYDGLILAIGGKFQFFRRGRESPEVHKSLSRRNFGFVWGTLEMPKIFWTLWIIETSCILTIDIDSPYFLGRISSTFHLSALIWNMLYMCSVTVRKRYDIGCRWVPYQLVTPTNGGKEEWYRTNSFENFQNPFEGRRTPWE